MKIDGSRIIVAADFPGIEPAKSLARLIGKDVAAFKVGNQLASWVGSREATSALVSAGCRVFRDGKWIDIPNTVAGTVEAEVQPGLVMFNMMCLGGKKMLATGKETAVRRAEALGLPTPLALGVTVLTSLDGNDLLEMGLLPKDLGNLPNLEIQTAPKHLAIKLAKLAQNAGLDGVIASAQEAPMIRKYCGPDFLIVTPGIRLPGKDAHDQKRVSTPFNAIRAGADYLVVGRDITEAENPISTVEQYNIAVAEAITDVELNEKTCPECGQFLAGGGWCPHCESGASQFRRDLTDNPGCTGPLPEKEVK